uniref:Uncharacterized protein n=1 Tax=Anguilla anguilla TaxID=7936 RepID=A0A0E9VU54_ANGAN
MESGNSASRPHQKVAWW